MRFVVLGASGFLGRSIVDTLRQQGHAVDIWSTRLEDTATLRHQLAEVGPCNVICAAGVSGRPTTAWSEAHPAETLHQNVTLPLQLAELCRQERCHLTLLGSGLVHEAETNDPDRWHTEDRPSPCPTRVYSRLRHLSEGLLGTAGYPNVLQLRILYPVLDFRSPRCFGAKMQARQQGVDPATVSVTVLPSLLPCLAELILAGRTGTLNFVNAGSIYLPELVQRSGVAQVTVTDRAPSYLQLDTHKLAQWLGRPVPTVQEALAPLYPARKVWYAPNGFEAYGEREIQAVVQALREGPLAAHGPRTAAFEQAVAARCGKRFGLFVNSGSSANLLALKALELPAGSPVVTPACTFATTVAPIVQCGYTPVFCDVEPHTYVPSVEQVMAVVDDTTRAVMLPNLIGSTPNWAALRQALRDQGRGDIVLIEDSCDTLTETTDSDVSTTSFYASHMVTTGGAGGMLMVNDEALLRRATMARDWGRVGNNTERMDERFNVSVQGIPYDWKFLYGTHGYNFKPTEMQAAFGLVQLERAAEFQVIRRRNFEHYLRRLAALSHRLVLPQDRPDLHWLALPLQIVPGCVSRHELLERLEEAQIQTRVCFSGNITKHPAFLAFQQDFPVSDQIMAHGFLLGCHHGMTLADVDRVCDVLEQLLQ